MAIRAASGWEAAGATTGHSFDLFYNKACVRIKIFFSLSFKFKNSGGLKLFAVQKHSRDTTSNSDFDSSQIESDSYLDPDPEELLVTNDRASTRDAGIGQ